MFVVGFVWMPVAGLTCTLIARLKRLDSIRYGLVGMGYSAAMFLPWVYLVSRLAGVQPPGIVTRGTYTAFVLVVWFFGSIISWWWFVATAISWWRSLSSSFEWYPDRIIAPYVILVLMLAAFNTWAFLLFLWRTISPILADTTSAEQAFADPAASPKSDFLLPSRWLLPFLIVALLQIPGIIIEILAYIKPFDNSP